MVSLVHHAELERAAQRSEPLMTFAKAGLRQYFQ